MERVKGPTMYKVLDFTRVLAGPWATQTLGDQGFDVLKVESPEGDETRSFLPYKEGVSVYFACTNRNKRSIVLDLKHPEAVPLVRRLVRGVDVVVDNFRPGVMARLGLDNLEAENPRLIQVAISAFGPGPMEDRAGYDLVLQSMGGITTLTGSPPQKAGPSIADLASAMVAVQGILFALLERERTGKGKKIDIRMFDVQHALLAYYASAWLNAGKVQPQPSNAHPSIAPYNLYPCADGWLSICCANASLYARLQAALDLPEDPRFASNASRVLHREALDACMVERLATGTVAFWEARLSAAGVPCGPALDVPASLAHPAARQVEIENWTFPMPPLSPLALKPPPALGEHSRQILQEAGFEEVEIQALYASKVVF